MVKKWRLAKKDSFNDKIIANKAIELAMQYIQKYIDETERYYIVVGNSQGEILATSSYVYVDSLECKYDLVANARFQTTINNAKPIQVLEDDIYEASYIDGDIVVASCSDHPYIDEVFSRVIAAVIRILLIVNLK